VKNKKILVISLAIAIVGVGSIAKYILTQSSNSAVVRAESNISEVEQTKSLDDVLGEQVTYDGHSYSRRHDIETVLFLGIDKPADERLGEVIGQNGRSDTLLLCILDKTAKTTKLLEISRDTITDIDLYSLDGQYLFTANTHINMQYAYGTDAKDGSRLSKKAVSKLLYSIPIDYTVSLTMQGIATIVDALGGVSINCNRDYTYIDKAFIKGSTIDMTGEQAYNYVHYRDISKDGSNNDRMDRQLDFIDAINKAWKEGDASENLFKFTDASKPYLASDIDGDTIKLLQDYKLERQINKLPGEDFVGELHDEYHVDQVALKKLILSLFYQEK